jgi:hypothetical protein
MLKCAPSLRNRVVSSAVEHCLHTAGVTGSNPVPPTIKQQLRCLIPREVSNKYQTSATEYGVNTESFGRGHAKRTRPHTGKLINSLTLLMSYRAKHRA